MIDQQAPHLRKNKVNLSDYDFEQDVMMRMSLDQLNFQDIQVLEEILFNSVKFPVEDLEDSLDMSAPDVMTALEKLLPTQLFSLEGAEVTVNKEKRKVFESHAQRFEDDFSPSLDFLHTLLKHVPIHILPLWYQVPKSSDNIFDSLIEKYFHTPQLFERHLLELTPDDETLTNIIKDVFDSEDLKLPASTLMKRYNIDHDQFEQYMLNLEYNFVLFSKYEKVGADYIHMVLPFHEWREYLIFVRNTTPSTIDNVDEISVYRDEEYAFSKDMASLLQSIQISPIKVVKNEDDKWTITKKELTGMVEALCGIEAQGSQDLLILQNYFANVINKLIMLKLAKVEGKFLLPCEGAIEWIRMLPEKRAFSTYKHPLNQICGSKYSSKLNNDRNIREIEKSISRVARSGWIYFDDFMEGLMVPLSEESKVELRREGKGWKYQTPAYTEEEKSFIKMTILEWLFESGIIRTGEHDNKICFTVTSLGKSLFGS
ncbi:MAG: hypothetical protein P0S95_06305 [Rhabdochlamydiaceae bacterium]|nr:hypothetical protein [Candidatus Amphrikana amoebophyrae]